MEGKDYLMLVRYFCRYNTAHVVCEVGCEIHISKGQKLKLFATGHHHQWLAQNQKNALSFVMKYLMLLAMGIWDLISSTTEAVKQHAPDPTQIKGACKSSYDYCSAAAGKIDDSVRVNSQKLNSYMPDEETQSRIGVFASKFAQNAGQYALREGYKLIPGGKVVGEIVSETMRDVKSEKQNKQEMEAMKEMIGGGGGKNSSSRNLLERLDVQSRGVELGYEKANQSPEEVLRIFMMKEFMGNRFADELLLPQIKHTKEI